MNDSKKMYDKAFGFFFENKNESIPLFREIEKHLSWCFGTRSAIKVNIGDKTWNLTPAQILDLSEAMCIKRQWLEDEKARSEYLSQFQDGIERRRQEQRLREFGNFLQFNRFSPDDLKD